MVAENAAVAPEGLVSPFALRVSSQRYLSRLKQLAQAIKTGGAVASLQLNHAGHFAWQEEPLPLSAVAAGNKTPRALSVQEIAGIVGPFAAEAAFVKEAGFDALGLHGGTGYLQAQFSLAAHQPSPGRGTMVAVWITACAAPWRWLRRCARR
ncbi:hypothetical protein DFAR_1520003 [Desulfarculales bacterium]